MKTKNFFRLLIVAVLLMSVSAAYSQPGKNFENRQMNCNQVNSNCKGIPNLTDEQMQKIEALRIEFLNETNSLKSDLKIKEAELHKLQIADNPDMTAISKKIDEIGSLRTQIQKKKAENHQKVRALLTKEQRVYFDNKPMRYMKNNKMHQKCNRMQNNMNMQ
jgi:Spy/CpxP family protein refolding chaperone